MKRKCELDYAELKEEYKKLLMESELLRVIDYRKKNIELMNENKELKKLLKYQRKKIQDLSLLLLAKMEKV